MTAATVPEWLVAAAIGTSTLPLLALTAIAADRDWHLPHITLTPATATAGHAVQAARIQAAAWLLLLAWHLGPKEAH
ncbi:hypothetical protein [Streptomyces sp. NPDC057115]|uniref:hypothetical protein n=1 Tax=unclassified Streptomyces TaxID=2593676 RepID=UPI0036356C2E